MDSLRSFSLYRMEKHKYTNDKDWYELMYKKFSGVWTTIANYFKEYDEHLLFEGMNEVSEYDFYLPDDKVNRVMLSVHNYDNYGVVFFATISKK